MTCYQGRDHAGRVRREEGRAAQPALVRVVSLVPSVTESLLAWDVVPIAVTRFCEQPELPHVGGTKDPDVDRIVSLAPDLVVVNDEENRKEDFDALEAAGLAVHVVRVTRGRRRRPRAARTLASVSWRHRLCDQLRVRPRCPERSERSSRSGGDRG